MRYCWLDLETTGLKRDKNQEIVEVAAVVTDGFFNKLDQFHAVVKPTKNCVWQHEVVEMHYKTGLLAEVMIATQTLKQVLPEFIAFLKKNLGNELSLIPAGSSVHFDTEFLLYVEPLIDEYLSHRHLDVSSIRIASVELFGPQAKAPLKPIHRALDDINFSMQELEFYKTNCFKAVFPLT